jgi:hypothetical protein
MTHPRASASPTITANGICWNSRSAHTTASLPNQTTLMALRNALEATGLLNGFCKADALSFTESAKMELGSSLIWRTNKEWSSISTSFVT